MLTVLEALILHKESTTPQVIQRRLMHINRLHRCTVESRVNQTGLPRSQHMMLMHLNRCDFKVSQKELAEHFEISPAAVAVTLKKLEIDGYIEKAASKDDNRFNEITITPKGRSIVEFSHKVFSEIDEKTFEGISNEERLKLLEILDKVETNLKSIMGKEE